MITNGLLMQALLFGFTLHLEYEHAETQVSDPLLLWLVSGRHPRDHGNDFLGHYLLRLHRVSHPTEKDLGWSRSELTGGFSLALLIASAMAFPVGTWIDRHGSRLLMTIGSILASLLMIAWSLVTDLRIFYLIWAGLGVCSAAILYEPAFAIMASWFTRHRSTALAVITFAAGLASTIFIPASDACRKPTDGGKLWPFVAFFWQSQPFRFMR